MSHIQNNIQFIRSEKGLSQSDFALKLEWSKFQVGAYEEGRSAPSIEKLIQLSDYTNIPIDILVKNDLRKAGTSSFIEVGNRRVLFPIIVDSDDDELIEIVPQKASAGYLSSYDDPEYIEQLQRIKLPFLPTGKHRAFPIKGDSMLPMKDGAFVIGKFVEDRSQIKSGKTYILLTVSNGMVYKRVVNNIDVDNSLILVSDNKSYEPYRVPIDEILELWEFTCSINTQEYNEEELKISSIAGMLNDLGVELKALEKLVS